jgi:hypothetical protein
MSDVRVYVHCMHLMVCVLVDDCSNSARRGQYVLI